MWCDKNYAWRGRNSEWRREYIRRNAVERRATFKMYGICVLCGQRDSGENHTACPECREKHAPYKAALRMKKKRMVDNHETKP